MEGFPPEHSGRKGISQEALLSRVVEQVQARPRRKQLPMPGEVFGLEELFRHAKALAETTQLLQRHSLVDDRRDHSVTVNL